MPQYEPDVTPDTSAVSVDNSDGIIPESQWQASIAPPPPSTTEAKHDYRKHGSTLKGSSAEQQDAAPRERMMSRLTGILGGGITGGYGGTTPAILGAASGATSTTPADALTSTALGGIIPALSKLPLVPSQAGNAISKALQGWGLYKGGQALHGALSPTDKPFNWLPQSLPDAVMQGASALLGGMQGHSEVPAAPTELELATKKFNDWAAQNKIVQEAHGAVTDTLAKARTYYDSVKTKLAEAEEAAATAKASIAAKLRQEQDNLQREASGAKLAGLKTMSNNAVAAKKAQIAELQASDPTTLQNPQGQQLAQLREHAKQAYANVKQLEDQHSTSKELTDLIGNHAPPKPPEPKDDKLTTLAKGAVKLIAPGVLGGVAGHAYGGSPYITEGIGAAGGFLTHQLANTPWGRALVNLVNQHVTPQATQLVPGAVNLGTK